MADTLAVIDMIDAIGANAGHIPAGTKRVAIYLTGPGIAWTNADVATLTRDDPQLQLIFRIDQSNDQHLDNLPMYLIKDIEKGASTLPTAIIQATTRMRRGLRTGFYFSRDDWDAVVSAIAAVQGLTDWVDFWVADWNFDRNGAIGFMESDSRIKAVQYTNGQFYDSSVTRADWPMPITPPPAPKPKGAAGTFRAQLEVNDKLAWDVHGTKGDGVVLGGPDQYDMVKTGVNRSTGEWLKPVPLPVQKAPKSAALARVLPLHPKVKAGGSAASALVAITAALSALGIHIPLSDTAQAAIIGGLPIVAAWFKKSA